MSSTAGDPAGSYLFSVLTRVAARDGRWDHGAVASETGHVAPQTEKEEACCVVHGLRERCASQDSRA